LLGDCLLCERRRQLSLSGKAGSEQQGGAAPLPSPEREHGRAQGQREGGERLWVGVPCFATMLRKDRPDVDNYGDQAFVLRLPTHMAGRVREMVRANDVHGLELRIDSGRDGGQHRPQAFKGRTGSFTIGAGTGEEVVLPASLMHVPTMVECYRTVDGRTGDYIKCADISQIMVAHESEEAALQASASYLPPWRQH